LEKEDIMLSKLKLVLVLVGMFLVFSCDPRKDDPAMDKVDKIKLKSEVCEKVLTKWIYEHSKQISMQTSGEIVKEVMKTNKPLLILAIAEIESNFIPSALSSKGAMGLTQVMPSVHEKELISKGMIKERRDLFDIVPSIRAGNYVLDFCLTQSKDNVPKALELYLGGQGGHYVKRILSSLANLYVAVRYVTEMNNFILDVRKVQKEGKEKMK